ncbi:DNA-directed RNA polymerase II subunit [Quillaja saponaria]|uniref:DNA-directed RNA polymerase subunit n=1 Tax=Quillaja saponaria TaxID=32244 RepID=A0AAD7VLL3_QUISA|nr:DNA-directed RNA polymerase II subunit [Quillaja saponaria]
MFTQVELLRVVAVIAKKQDRNRLVSRRSIITHLLEDLLSEKASKDHGYFLAITGLKSVGKGKLVDESNVLFPVVFDCRTFIPSRGEILEGVVYRVNNIGVFMKCGPVKYAFLSARKMPKYQYTPGESPIFMNDELSKIAKDTVIRFLVLAVKWVETRNDIKKEFLILASLEGDSLGPIALSGFDESDL